MYINFVYFTHAILWLHFMLSRRFWKTGLVEKHRNTKVSTNLQEVTESFSIDEVARATPVPLHRCENI